MGMVKYRIKVTDLYSEASGCVDAVKLMEIYNALSNISYDNDIGINKDDYSVDVVITSRDDRGNLEIARILRAYLSRLEYRRVEVEIENED